MTGRLLTARDVAGQLGLSVETVLRWARRGELPAVHLSNRAIRFREEDIEQFVEQRTSAKVVHTTLDIAANGKPTLPTRVGSVVRWSETEKGPRG